ncbi:TetR/AcrR family transcriptional regulator [Actinokineospora iranica]|uniref:Transcriptional regulator, TetR family n=1 Tax=Actinokineospora iranica TaxID=1271860 RepID=A0A1G6LIQ2_9PSEU|nr:TetR/AcrR family transcriptional regulator [Actinokineospora iranica]SDC43089.1 transcriptional regulator, TetR family [Actinokineospora iranica]
MGRTSTARDRLIDAAGTLMGDRGYAALGVAEICARADVRKGSFYHFFESKQALTVEAVEAQWQRRRATWLDCLGGDLPAVRRIERLVRAQVDSQRADKRDIGAVQGCLFGNLALELSNSDEVVRARVAEVFDAQIALLTAALRDAEAEGSIPPGAATPATARSVVAQIEGMVLFAKLANDPDVLDNLWPQTALLLRIDGAESG